MNGEMLKPVQAMLNSPRCGARTRAGTWCQSPVVRDKTRCRMHGGAAGSGAPYGNQNAHKSGRYTAKMIARRKEMNAFLRTLRNGSKSFD